MAAPGVGSKVGTWFDDAERKLRIGKKIGKALQSGDKDSTGTAVLIASFTATLVTGDVIEFAYQGAYRCSAAAGWGEITLRAKAGTVAASGDALASGGQADVNAPPTTPGLLTPIRWVGEFTAAADGSHVFSAWVQRKSGSGTFTCDAANGNTGMLSGKIIDVA